MLFKSPKATTLSSEVNVNNLKKKGIKALLWDTVSKISNQGVAFIVTIIMARSLNPADFGLVAICLVFIGIARIFTDVGLGAALIQQKKTTQLHFSSVFYFNIFVASFFTLATYYSANTIANFYGNASLTPLLEVCSLMFLLYASCSVQEKKLRKSLQYNVIAKASIISGLLSGIIGIALVLTGFGVWSLVFQAISSQVVKSLFLWGLSNWKPSLIFSLSSLKELWGFGFRMFLIGLIDSIYSRLDYLIIGKLYSMEVLGFFERAKNVNSLIIKYTSGTLMSVLFPVFSEIQNDLPRIQSIVKNSFTILSFTVFILIGGLYLTVQDLIVFLYSEKWLQSVKYAEILLLSAFSYPISALLVSILSARGKSKTLLRLQIIEKSIATLNFVNAAIYGLESFLYGLIIVSFLTVLLNIIYAAKEIKLKAKEFIRPLTTSMSFSVISIITTLHFVELFSFSPLLLFIFKGGLFLLTYLCLNALFRTQGIIKSANMLNLNKLI